MRMKRWLLLVALTATGCTYSVHQVHMGDFSPYQAGGKKIMAMVEQPRILNIATDTDYVEQAYRELQAKCEGGSIVGVSTEFITHHHFFHARDRIYMKARCLRAGDARGGV